jgi:hypothetical protein
VRERHTRTDRDGEREREREIERELRSIIRNLFLSPKKLWARAMGKRGGHTNMGEGVKGKKARTTSDAGGNLSVRTHASGAFQRMLLLIRLGWALQTC